MATQEFKGKVGLGAVIPGDREFGADFLDGCGLEWRRHIFQLEDLVMCGGLR
jgi:hypothetical protein